MPFKSKAQRSYLAIHNPKVAHEFAEHTPKGAQLPEHVGGMSKLAGMYKGRKGK